MKLLKIVKLLDGQPNATRRELIIEHLDALGAPYTAQPYATGTNLVVDLGRAGRKIGVGSHFDQVPASAGANDNGSAVAVGLDIVRRHQEAGSAAGVRVFFSDEEETSRVGNHHGRPISPALKSSSEAGRAQTPAGASGCLAKS